MFRDKDMKKLKDLAPDRDFDTIFMGGEPLLNPELIPIMYKTDEFSQMVSVPFLQMDYY